MASAVALFCVVWWRVSDFEAVHRVPLTRAGQG